MPLCDICANITFFGVNVDWSPEIQSRSTFKHATCSDSTDAVDTLQDHADGHNGREEQRRFVAFLHPSLSHLKESIALGRQSKSICAFCEMISDALRAVERHRLQQPPLSTVGKSADRSDKGLWLQFGDEPFGAAMTRAMTDSEYVWLHVTVNGIVHPEILNIDVGRKGIGEPAVLAILMNGRYQWKSYAELGDDFVESNSASDSIDGQLGDDNTGSQRALNLAGHWLNHCLEKHLECNLSPPRREDLPSRLLEIQSSHSGIVLALTDRSHCASVDYVTLSHRWGFPTQPVQTLSANEAAHRSGISFESLPRTFQHAVLITWKLGYRYLWIDSLCIVQDSQQDKLSELPRMGRYYRNAVLSIAADSAENSHGGCFQPRNGISLRPQKLIVTFFNEPELTALSPVTITPIVGRKTSSWNSASCLLDRGWVMQEHALARRVLHYRKDILSFTCSCLLASETFPEGFSTNQDLIADPAPMLELVQSSLLHSTAFRIRRLVVQSEPRRPIYREWQVLVDNYTNRNLTYVTDRLDAISGIASEFHQILQDDYVAGVWRNDQSALFWRTDGTVERQIEGLAPSWSWACMATRIRHTLIVKSGVEIARARTTDMTWTLSTTNSFGPVKVAQVKVISRARRAILRREHGAQASSLMFDGRSPDVPTNSSIFLDYPSLSDLSNSRPSHVAAQGMFSGSALSRFLPTSQKNKLASVEQQRVLVLALRVWQSENRENRFQRSMDAMLGREMTPLDTNTYSKCLLLQKIKDQQYRRVGYAELTHSETSVWDVKETQVHIA